MIGILKDDGPDEHQKKYIEEKRAEYERTVPDMGESEENEFPAKAGLCTKCHTKAMIKLDNCLTCLNCGESKCS